MDADFDFVGLLFELCFRDLVDFDFDGDLLLLLLLILLRLALLVFALTESVWLLVRIISTLIPLQYFLCYLFMMLWVHRGQDVFHRVEKEILQFRQSDGNGDGRTDVDRGFRLVGEEARVRGDFRTVRDDFVVDCCQRSSL